MALNESQRSTLIAAALSARETSYSPYSNFRVGAALLLDDGEVIKGCNVESASYGGTICAERTAVVKAVSEGHRKFLGLAVASDVKAPISPCGICRQVLREFCALDMPILLLPSQYSPLTTPQRGASLKEAEEKAAAGGEGEEWNVVVETSMGELLPMSFGPSHLAKPDPK